MENFLYPHNKRMKMDSRCQQPQPGDLCSRVSGCALIGSPDVSHHMQTVISVTAIPGIPVPIAAIVPPTPLSLQ